VTDSELKSYSLYKTVAQKEKKSTNISYNFFKSLNYYAIYKVSTRLVEMTFLLSHFFLTVVIFLVFLCSSFFSLTFITLTTTVKQRKAHSAERYLALVVRHCCKSATARRILPYHFQLAELDDGRTGRRIAQLIRD
jgi:hypothetical protein